MKNDNIKVGTTCDYKEIKAVEKYSKPPQSRYTEASLIKKLDEMGIGRPSTYSTIITNIQDRNYIEKKSVPGKEMEVLTLTLNYGLGVKESKDKIKVGGENNKLFPTNIGKIVNEFLYEKYPEIFDYSFTSHIENQLDLVAQGEKNWQDVVREIYDIIKPKLRSLDSTTKLEKEKYKRKLGEDPSTGCEIFTYIGKYGPLVHLKDDGDKNKFAPLKDIDIKEVTLEQALELLKYPLVLENIKTK